MSDGPFDVDAIGRLAEAVQVLSTVPTVDGVLDLASPYQGVDYVVACNFCRKHGMSGTKSADTFDEGACNGNDFGVSDQQQQSAGCQVSCSRQLLCSRIFPYLWGRSGLEALAKGSSKFSGLIGLKSHKVDFKRLTHLTPTSASLLTTSLERSSFTKQQMTWCPAANKAVLTSSCAWKHSPS